MYPLPPATESLPATLLRTLSTCVGPFAAAAFLFLMAGLIRNLSLVPGDPALTWADLASTVIGIAAEALVILIAGWSVLSGGAAKGFAALAMIPSERAFRVLAYAVVFFLWLLVLLLLFGALAGALAAGQGPLGEALVIACFYAVILTLMWLQLGFLFPDILSSGESGVILAMALGISTGRRVFAALALPALLLTVPIVTGEALIWHEERLLRLSGGLGAMTIIDWLAEILFAILSVIETAAYMVAMTRLYQSMTPGGELRSDMWR